jgi:UPF0755 protein
MTARRRRRPVWRRLAALALVALLAAAGALLWAWRQVGEPHRGYPGSERILVIEPGTSATAILEQLAAAGVLQDARLARLYLVQVLGDPPLRAGEYRFAEPLSTRQVLDRLVRGDVLLHSVTLVEGLTLEETAAALAAAGMGAADRFRLALRDPSPIAELDPQARDLEGYLFPDTYSFARGTPAAEIVAARVRSFRRRFAADVRPLLAAPETSTRALVTLASIVEKESGLAAERPLVAAVFANRLRLGMALYADPTIIFALKRRGTWDGNLRRPDLALDDPYNTYRYPGLPPGPICSPGLQSLQAAAAPAAVDHLYFVSRNDGSHVFASSLEEHNRNVERWQRRYWRERGRR